VTGSSGASSVRIRGTQAADEGQSLDAPMGGKIPKYTFRMLFMAILGQNLYLRGS